MNPALVRESIARRLYRRSVVTGQIALPAVPGMIDEYVRMCDNLFAGVGRKFTAQELDHLKTLLEGELAVAYAASPRSNIVISYNAPVGKVLNYHIKPEWWTIEGAYENWIATRTPPLFGTEPDARVCALAAQAADPRSYRVLDIGAGTGRNALALARRGHSVDVVELTAKFAEMIRSDAARESLDVRVIQRDVFSTMADLRQDYQLVLLSEVVSDFRTTEQLRKLFELATHCLAPVGSWCSTLSWRTPATYRMTLRVNSASSATQASSPGTKCPVRQQTYLLSWLPTTRCTSTRKRTFPTAPGRPRAGMTHGSAASTCSTSSVSNARSRCAGWSTRECVEADLAARYGGTSRRALIVVPAG